MWPAAGPAVVADRRAQPVIVRGIVAHHRAVEVLAGFLLIGVAVLDLADKWESIRAVFGI